MFPLLPPSPSPSSTPLWYIPSQDCGAFLTVLGSLRSQSHLSRGASVKQEAGPHRAHTSASAAERPLSLTSRCKQSRKGRSRAQSAAGCENGQFSAPPHVFVRVCSAQVQPGVSPPHHQLSSLRPDWPPWPLSLHRSTSWMFLMLHILVPSRLSSLHGAHGVLSGPEECFRGGR